MELGEHSLEDKIRLAQQGDVAAYEQALVEINRIIRNNLRSRVD